MSLPVAGSAENEVTVGISGGHRPGTPVAPEKAAAHSAVPGPEMPGESPVPETLRLLAEPRLALTETRLALTQARVLLSDSELRAAQEHELALRLQRAVMSPGVRQLAVAGLEIAARCRPAKRGSLVAGDWYDTLRLPGGDLLFVVGDIAGHGIDAVTGMVTARHALRGLAATGAGPAELVGTLNRAACLFADGLTGTVICGRYSPRNRVLRWARAGHLPPVLVRDGVATVQPMPAGLLLGVLPDGEYEQSQLPLLSGDTLFFY